MISKVQTSDQMKFFNENFTKIQKNKRSHSPFQAHDGTVLRRKHWIAISH